MVFSSFVTAVGGSAQPGDQKQMRLRKLVEDLKHVAVTGPAVGPSTGITDNEMTRAVVRQGSEIVPVLVSALDDSTWNQSVWILFCLRKLKAPEAKARILQLERELQQGARFSEEPHNLTLDVQISTYLADVDKWKANAAEQSHGSKRRR